jgi:hypothetical protein
MLQQAPDYSYPREAKQETCFQSSYRLMLKCATMGLSRSSEAGISTLLLELSILPLHCSTTLHYADTKTGIHNINGGVGVSGTFLLDIHAAVI